MSQLIIRRFFETSVYKNALKHKSVRLFSSIPAARGLICMEGMDIPAKIKAPLNLSFASAPTYPFLLIDYVLNIPDSPDGRVIRIYGYDHDDPDRLTNATTGILIRDKKLVEEVRHAMTVGFSHHGLGFKVSKNSLDILINDDNPSNSKSTTSCIHLPPLPTGFRIQSVAMTSSSSSDLNSEDWVVCVKSWGSQLSLFRPGHQWINIKSSLETIHPFSSLMYSTIDEKFYIPTSGGNYLCCLDLYFKEGDHPEFINLDINDLPESVVPELNELMPCSRTSHLVESPSGEQFLVMWYSCDTRSNRNKVETLMHRTCQFMVFRADEAWDINNVRYTEDIGDLCIFLGHSEAFCIPASSCPGLKPNCIYFVGHSFGVYDLTIKTCTTFYTEEDVPLRNLEFPYWPPPVPLYT